MTRAALTRRGVRPRVPGYADLGVRTFINCQGTYTVLGGSLPLDQVTRAAEAAGGGFVALGELYEAAGGWIAARTGAEWGLVTSGSAAALCQLTAACIAGADPEKIARLPQTGDLPNEVVTPAGHGHPFEHAIRMAGARILRAASVAELDALVGERTAMLGFLGEAAGSGPIPLRDLVEAGRRCGVPVVVDAAAERPDAPNPYLAEGADAVIYSGGKCLRGPQDSGLVLGRKALLEAAALNGAPHMSLGRPMKVSKETLMGLLAALDMWFARDHEAEWKRWEGMLRHVAGRLAALPSVQTRIVPPPRPSNVAPTLSIRWDPALVPLANTEVKRLLAEGTPSIEMPLDGDGLSIMPFMMEPGEERAVARRLLEVLGQAGRRAEAQSRAEAGPRAEAEQHSDAAQVAGSWNVQLRFLRGQSRHRLEIRQQGSDLTGRHRGSYAEAPLEGRVRGGEIEIRSVLAWEESELHYRFHGRVEAEGMAGSVDLGEYGSAEWTARRESEQ